MHILCSREVFILFCVLIYGIACNVLHGLICPLCYFMFWCVFFDALCSAMFMFFCVFMFTVHSFLCSPACCFMVLHVLFVLLWALCSGSHFMFSALIYHGYHVYCLVLRLCSQCTFYFLLCVDLWYYGNFHFIVRSV